MQNPIDTSLSSSSSRKPGRPRKSDTKTPAQRAKQYRTRQKANGLKAVKCYLPPEAIAYLNALRQIHDVTLSEAISIALMAVIRGEHATGKKFFT